MKLSLPGPGLVAMRTNVNQVVNKNERIALYNTSGFRFMTALDGTASKFPLVCIVRSDEKTETFVVRQGETYKFEKPIRELQIDFPDATTSSKYDVDLLAPGDLIWKGA